jgi:hypothetical protein
MRETTIRVDIKDEETGEQLFSGSCVVKVPKRGERASLQQQAMAAARKAEEDPTSYFDWSESILDKYLVSIDVEAGDEKIQNREDLYYFEAESLISFICQTAAAGVRLGKKNA